MKDWILPAFLLPPVSTQTKNLRECVLPTIPGHGTQKEDLEAHPLLTATEVEYETTKCHVLEKKKKYLGFILKETFGHITALQSAIASESKMDTR